MVIHSVIFHENSLKICGPRAYFCVKIILTLTLFSTLNLISPHPNLKYFHGNY